VRLSRPRPGATSPHGADDRPGFPAKPREKP